MYLSERQSVFIDYLLEQIGFDEYSTREKYMNQLKEVDFTKEVKHKTTHKIVNGRSMEITRSYIEKNFKILIERLLLEVKLKKNKYSIKSKNFENSVYFSATDLGSYSFCPVRYSLGKTFEVDVTNAMTEGTKLHDEHTLLKKGSIIDKISTNEYSSEQNSIISKIRRSKLIFSGHSESHFSFKNENENFIGIPDYIFLDNDGNYFVVEEKFQKTNNPHYKDHYYDTDYDEYEKGMRQSLRNKYYNSHKIQIISYIRNIREYPIKYGYLIYWYYSYEDLKPYIFETGTHLFDLSPENNKYYEKVKDDLVRLKRDGQIEFDVNLNYTKCARCSVRKYCSHKNGKIDKVSIPFPLDDIRLYTIEFPEKLKKKL